MDKDSFIPEEAGEKSIAEKQHNLLETLCNESAAGSDIESRFCGTQISVGYTRAISILKADKYGYLQPPATPKDRIPQQPASSAPLTSSINDFNPGNPTDSPKNITPPRSFRSRQQPREIGTNWVPALVSPGPFSIFPVTSTGTAWVGPEQQVSGTPLQ
jgi:hypothetical protein